MLEDERSQIFVYTEIMSEINWENAIDVEASADAYERLFDCLLSLLAVYYAWNLSFLKMY